MQPLGINSPSGIQKWRSEVSWCLCHSEPSGSPRSRIPWKTGNWSFSITNNNPSVWRVPLSKISLSPWTHPIWSCSHPHVLLSYTNLHVSTVSFLSTFKHAQALVTFPSPYLLHILSSVYSLPYSQNKPKHDLHLLIPFTHLPLSL